MSDSNAYMFGYAIGQLVCWLALVVFSCIMGWIAVRMARKRNFSIVPAFFLGFFFSFVTLIILALIPIKKQDNVQAQKNNTP